MLAGDIAVTFAVNPRLKSTGRNDAPDKKGTPMRFFSRLVIASAVVSCFSMSGLAYTGPGQSGDDQPSEQHILAEQDAQAMFGHSSQGYLGISGSDVDNDRAAALKLKEATGAEIISVDRDAPAGKAGLRVHDVILQLNGQPVAGEAQLSRMLRETPAGHKINLLISRDGQLLNFTIQLADRATVEQNAWTQQMVVPAPDDDETIFLEGPSGHGSGNGFFGAFSLGSPSVGVELDVLGSQLADYFGVKDHQGLLVKHVADNSPASRAGLKAGDVITQANGQKMATLGEWMKMLHANRGKQVQLTLVRNHKEETVTLEAASGKNHGELMPDQFLMPNELPLTGNDDLAWIENQIESGPLTEQVQPTIDLENLPTQIQVQPSVDLQVLQKQLQDQQLKTNQQMQQLQQNLLDHIYVLNQME
jgi:serine protease Do